MSEPTVPAEAQVSRLPRRARRRITPAAQSLALGFTLLVLSGALLLMLPVASRQGTVQSFIDALFTSTSAVTTTGLVVVDTGTYYSLFGQIVILVLFQVGGLGYMAYIALLAVVTGRRLSLAAGITLRESIAGLAHGEYGPFVRSVFGFTLLFEAIGTIFMTGAWVREFGFSRALYLGLFHSISAFCTAGFSLFSDSFMRYRYSAVLNLTVALVTIAGGIGFFVLRDLSRYLQLRRRRGGHPRLSTHSKMAVAVSLVLAAAGSWIVFVAEPGEVVGFRWGERSATATFQALSASTTTGFNSVDIGRMTQTSLFALIILMFVGASPGGTGGGIKTTTLGVVLSTVVALLGGGEDAVAFRRRIVQDTVHRALTIGLLATVLVTVDTLVLTATEQASLLQLLFEAVSAFGTVGLSTGITPTLSAAGKLVLILTMLVGRVGPLAIGFALWGRPRAAKFRYAEEKVFIG